MLLISVPRITNRINYIFELFFKIILKVEYSITDNQELFESHSGPKFSYGKDAPSTGLFFGASNLLFESGISRQPIENLKAGTDPEFFKVPQGALAFDPFAAGFYLVSRYEEYLPHFKDRHGRFKVEDSLAFKADFLSRPIVNIWALSVKNILLKTYPDTSFPALNFTFTPTIDIDNAYAYKYKGVWRSILSSASLLLKLEFTQLIQRIGVHLGIKHDPYDTYDKQAHTHKMHNVKPLYFVLLGDYGKNDKNLSHKNAHYISLIQKLDQRSEVCLHPSYKASSDIQQLKTEKLRLEKILGRKVSKSRAHFIRVNIPSTYQMLVDIGITEDYSMGYASQVGYRASIATPYYFYDLEKENATALKIHPFVVMDTTLKKYLHIRAKDVMSYLFPFVEEAKAVGGNFTFIFHNESMGGSKVWKNWGDIYEQFFKLMIVKRYEKAA